MSQETLKDRADFAPLNFHRWIEENRHLLKPPVCNQQIWANREFMVTVVGGPNSRLDYHVNEGEEFFYQLEGDIVLKILTAQGPDKIEVRKGEIFLLPPKVPHSPQRPAGSIGLVIERRRLPNEKDGFIWICQHCDEKLHEEYFHLSDIVKDIPPVMNRFFQNESLTTCKKCGTRAQKS